MSLNMTYTSGKYLVNLTFTSRDLNLNGPIPNFTQKDAGAFFSKQKKVP